MQRKSQEKNVRPISLGLHFTSWFVYAFLYIPILVVAVFSFNTSKYGLELKGFTTHWYSLLLENDVVKEATRNTLVLAFISTIISTILGTLLGYGLYRYRFPGAKLFAWLMYIPVVTPDIIMAVSLVLLFGAIRQVLPFLGPVFELGLGTMVMAHVTFQIAFVAIVVRSRLAGLDPALEEAARDLYASPVEAIRQVVLPLALPGIVSGALLAFTLSIDDFVISFFTSGPTSQTLPILIYSSVKRGITPDINALSTIIVLVTLVAVIASSLLRKRE